jgi:hypothetical protein
MNFLESSGRLEHGQAAGSFARVYVGGGGAVSTKPDGQAAKRAIRNLIIPDHEKENSAMLSKLLLSAAFVAALSSLAFAATGTPLEQAACRQDVRKFCHALKEANGDEAYVQCLQAHRDQLSAACRKVLTDNGV